MKRSGEEKKADYPDDVIALVDRLQAMEFLTITPEKRHNYVPLIGELDNIDRFGYGMIRVLEMDPDRQERKKTTYLQAVEALSRKDKAPLCAFLTEHDAAKDFILSNINLLDRIKSTWRVFNNHDLLSGNRDNDPTQPIATEEHSAQSSSPAQVTASLRSITAKDSSCFLRDLAEEPALVRQWMYIKMNDDYAYLDDSPPYIQGVNSIITALSSLPEDARASYAAALSDLSHNEHTMVAFLNGQGSSICAILGEGNNITVMSDLSQGYLEYAMEQVLAPKKAQKSAPQQQVNEATMKGVVGNRSRSSSFFIE